MFYKLIDYQERFKNPQWDIDDSKAQVWYCENKLCKWVGYNEDRIDFCCPECGYEDVFSYFEPRTEFIPKYRSCTYEIDDDV